MKQTKKTYAARVELEVKERCTVYLEAENEIDAARILGEGALEWGKREDFEHIGTRVTRIVGIEREALAVEAEAAAPVEHNDEGGES